MVNEFSSFSFYQLANFVSFSCDQLAKLKGFIFKWSMDEFCRGFFKQLILQSTIFFTQSDGQILQFCPTTDRQISQLFPHDLLVKHVFLFHAINAQIS